MAMYHDVNVDVCSSVNAVMLVLLWNVRSCWIFIIECDPEAERTIKNWLDMICYTFLYFFLLVWSLRRNNWLLCSARNFAKYCRHLWPHVLLFLSEKYGKWIFRDHVRSFQLFCDWIPPVSIGMTADCGLWCTWEVYWHRQVRERLQQRRVICN